MSKGQAHMMEYIIMTLFIVIIITVIIFFLTGWQFTQMRSAESKTESDKALYMMKFFIKSPFFTNDESLFDDAKMLAFKKMDECEGFNAVFGREWFARIHVLGETLVPCTPASSYGDCNSWSFCEQMNRKSFSYVLPVNIYWNSDNTNKLGVLEVGIYHD